jgi:hypothetical protein
VERSRLLISTLGTLHSAFCRLSPSELSASTHVYLRIRIYTLCARHIVVMIESQYTYVVHASRIHSYVVNICVCHFRQHTFRIPSIYK